MARVKLFDCCWVELEGVRGPQLAIQVKRHPALFAVGAHVYTQNGLAHQSQPTAPAIVRVHATRLTPVRRSA